MHEESFTLTHEKSGATAVATGKVVTYDASARTRRALVRGVGGLVLGGVSILIPLLHFFSTWILPLIGAYLAFQAFNTEAAVGKLSGTCPACKEEVRLGGGALGGPARTMCPRCMENLGISREAASTEAA